MPTDPHFPASYWRHIDRVWEQAKVLMEAELRAVAKRDAHRLIPPLAEPQEDEGGETAQ